MGPTFFRGECLRVAVHRGCKFRVAQQFLNDLRIVAIGLQEC